MYLIREVYIAKPGHAGEFAELMKAEMASWKDFKGHVLLDFATEYNKIVVQYEIDSLANFENMFLEHWKQKTKTKGKAGKEARKR